jgi:hypothetical protein
MSVLFSTLNPMDATALCTLPCFIFWWREWSTGALDKFGFIAAFGPILILYSIIANVATFSRLVPSDVIQTYVYVLPLLVLGVAGWLFPESTADDVGIALIKPSDTVLWVFVGRSLLSLTALLATLFKAGNTSAAMTNAIRNSTLVTGITTLLDILWFRRKTFKDANFSSDKAIRFTIQTLFWAALMFLLPGPL